jgi:hypothetical protein
MDCSRVFPMGQELAPQLANQPMQIDLFSETQTNCVSAQLGSASYPWAIKTRPSWRGYKAL